MSMVTVGRVFVDGPHHTEGHPLLAYLQAIGTGMHVEDLPHRIGEPGNERTSPAMTPIVGR